MLQVSAVRPSQLWKCVAAWLAACWIVLAPALAQTVPAARESEVKAAFLYTFGNYVDWPAGTFGSPDDPMVIAISGDDEVARDLEQLIGGRTIGGRPVLARRIREPQALAGAHILFIASTRDARLRELLPPAPAPVLVVTEQEGALRLGSSINFSAQDGRIRFSASPAAAEARGLKLSSRLLAIAQNVEGRGR